MKTILLRAAALAVAGVGALAPAMQAEAQVAKSGAFLPLSLAIEAASAAIAACEAGGYNVSVAVVDASGVVKLQAKGDHSTIHTRDSSFRKAYSVVTLGPVFKFETSGDLAALVAKSPAGPALASLPDILPLAGGVAIKSGDEIIAAIGVGGAPGGDKDEACAQAGVARIRDRIPTGPHAS
ncbi:GlcG/HbpS family heme-binding protein [Zavarzinia sp.]|uniref:GlcG/HbpS family heme-binding protein n=1 Tax=Zavarzinia sp. TaxID=2027920 RepID=UPI003BB6611A